MELQENRAVNLALAAPKISGILIRPGETFSFWYLVGSLSARKGYLEGLTITNGQIRTEIGGGMRQLTDLIHWMVLHTPLKIVEYHRNDNVDLFPDANRQLPFGTGTSIMYNYLDYRFYNPTDTAYQLVVYTTPAYLCGELRAAKPQEYTYHVAAEHERFERQEGVVYHCGEVYRRTIDPRTGDCVKKQLVRRNHAKVMDDTSQPDVRSR